MADTWHERDAESLGTLEAKLRTRISELEAESRVWQEAARSAASTSVTAIERIQEMEKVVQAAEDWARGGSHSALTEAVKQWQRLKKRWS